MKTTGCAQGTAGSVVSVLGGARVGGAKVPACDRGQRLHSSRGGTRTGRRAWRAQRPVRDMHGRPSGKITGTKARLNPPSGASAGAVQLQPSASSRRARTRLERESD